MTRSAPTRYAQDASYLARADADSVKLRARIRGLSTVDDAEAFLRAELDHRRRQDVVGAINARIEELRSDE